MCCSSNFFNLQFFFVISISINIVFILNINENHQPKLDNDYIYNSESKEYHNSQIDNTSLADDLFEKINILCWIKTYPGNEHRVRAIINTWGKRCNKFLVMSSKNNSNINAIGLPVREGRSNLWKKVKLAYQYIYDKHLNSADWFLNTDDDTYVIMENLRYMLSAYSPEHPYYLGCRLRKFGNKSFMSGGAGYVISKKALKLVVEESFPNQQKCPNNPVDDVAIAICLNSINATFVDTRRDGKERFFPFSADYHLIPIKDNTNWYKTIKYYDYNEGIGNLTELPISFHYIDHNRFYLYDYLIYNVRPYGRIQIPAKLPNKINQNISINVLI